MRRVSIVMILMLATILAVSCGKKVEDPAKIAFMTYLPDQAALAASEGKQVLLDFYTDW